MMKIFLAAAVICTAAASNVGRRAVDDEALLFKIRDDVVKMQKDLFNVNSARMMATNTLLLANMYRDSASRVDSIIGENKIAQKNIVDMTGTLDDLYKTTVTAVEQVPVDNADAVKKLQETYSAVVAKSAKAVDALKTATLLSSKLAKEKASLAAKQAAMKKKVVDAATKKISALAGKLDGKQTMTRHIWSGGAKRTHQSGGWHDFEYDREEFNTAAPYFKKDGNNRFKILKLGLYHFSYFWMGHCHHSHRHAHFYIRDQNINSNYHQYNNHWHTNWYETTWHVKPGAQIRMRVYACNHAWH